MKNIVPPAPLEIKEEDKVVAKMTMHDVLSKTVMTLPFWRDKARVAGELCDIFDAKPEGPWAVQDKAHEALLIAYQLPQPGGGALLLGDPKQNRFFLRTKQSVDEAESV